MAEFSTRRMGSAEIAGVLRRDIGKGVYVARDRLPPERNLADAYGVARGTIREALTQLESDGLVEIKPGSGTYVSSGQGEAHNPAIAGARPLELIDARFALEPHICRLAVLHGRQRDFDDLERLAETMESSITDSVAFSVADTDFHTRLAQTTGNNLIFWIVSEMSSVRNQEQWSRMRQLTLDPAIINQYNQQHRTILDALRAREPELAADAMKQHLETARLSLTRAAAT